MDEDYDEKEQLSRIAAAMKSSVGPEEDKSSLYGFLHNVIVAKNTIKIGNLEVEGDYDELGIPSHNVRGCLEMARISEQILENPYFKEYFLAKAEETLATSLSRKGFLIRQGTTQTKQVADITRKRNITKGFLGRQRIEEQGGDTVRA